MAALTTRAPGATKSFAVPAPIPLAPPVMTVTFSGLIILGVPGYAQTIINGAILIAALAFAGFARRVAARS